MIFTVTVSHQSRPKTKHLIHASDPIEARCIVLNHFSLIGEQVRHIEVETVEVEE